jgi:small GTP-binding protein
MAETKVPGCKVVLLGDSGVGKTCIIARYISGSFDKNSPTTNGASFCSKNVRFDQLGKNLLLDIWDTAGQEKYKALTKFFYKDAAVCILVYDVTRKESFQSLKDYWYSQLKENSEPDIVIGVAGNKSDLYENEEVKEDEAREWAKEIGAVFELTSAQNNTGINDLFLNVGYKFLDPSFKPEIEIGNKEDKENKDETKEDKKIVLDKKDLKKETGGKKKRTFC